jgi:hypothetical protein
MVGIPSDIDPVFIPHAKALYAIRAQSHDIAVYAPWHFLYFFPLPQGHGSLRPSLGPSETVFGAVVAPPAPAN